MNKTAREAVDFIEMVLPLLEGFTSNLYLAVSYTSIAPASQAAKNTPIVIGAQNMHEARDGAFTGEMSSLMLKEAGASFVILGHSERRVLFGEDDARIHKKVVRALADDLIPILCVGETLEERAADQTEKVLKKQLKAALNHISKEDAEKILIAYEPVWAIGSGTSATPEIAQVAHSFIRAEITHLLGKHSAEKIAILYGGSVSAENVHSLLAKEEIDGFLIGGASLDPLSFSTIAKINKKKKP